MTWWNAFVSAIKIVGLLFGTVTVFTLMYVGLCSVMFDGLAALITLTVMVTTLLTVIIKNS